MFWLNTGNPNIISTWFRTGFVSRLTRRVSLEEQELFTLPEHLSKPPVFSGVRVTQSLILGVCFVDHCLSFCNFSFGHCVVCSSAIYGFRLPLWYFQTLLDSGTRLSVSKIWHAVPITLVGVFEQVPVRSVYRYCKWLSSVFVRTHTRQRGHVWPDLKYNTTVVESRPDNMHRKSYGSQTHTHGKGVSPVIIMSLH